MILIFVTLGMTSDNKEFFFPKKRADPLIVFTYKYLSSTVGRVENKLQEYWTHFQWKEPFELVFQSNLQNIDPLQTHSSKRNDRFCPSPTQWHHPHHIHLNKETQQNTIQYNNEQSNTTKTTTTTTKLIVDLLWHQQSWSHFLFIRSYYWFYFNSYLRTRLAFGCEKP